MQSRGKGEGAWDPKSGVSCGGGWFNSKFFVEYELSRGFEGSCLTATDVTAVRGSRRVALNKLVIFARAIVPTSIAGCTVVKGWVGRWFEGGLDANRTAEREQLVEVLTFVIYICIGI